MRAVIAEDAVLLREGLARLLDEGGFDVVDCVADGEALLRAVERHQPDVCVVDIRMPPTFSDEGVRAALVIRKQWPDVSLLMLSQYVEERYAVDLLAGDSERDRLPAQGPRRRRGASSSRRCAASRPAAPRWTPRSSPSCWCAPAARTRSSRSPRASARCSG